MTDAVDLFAGPGGWSVACRELGIQELGIEWDKAACETRIAAGHETLQADVRALDPIDFPAQGFIASPPCQTFSMAGKGAGRQALDQVLDGLNRMWVGEELPKYEDDRTALVLEPMRWILARADIMETYEWIALEQVPTVLPVWEKYAEILRWLGYSVDTGILHAEQYGVPQTRKRAILVARWGEEVSLPKPTHTKYRKGKPRQEGDLLPWVSMADALSRGMTERPSMTVTGGGARTGGAEPFGNGARKSMQKEIEEGRWIPTAAVPGDTSWSEVRPSPTIVGSFAPDVVASPGWRKAGDGPRQKQPGSIRVTVEEAAVLQSFPKDYPWQGSKTKQFEQVGNAIPPLLAKAVLVGVSQIVPVSP